MASFTIVEHDSKLLVDNDEGAYSLPSSSLMVSEVTWSAENLAVNDDDDEDRWGNSTGSGPKATTVKVGRMRVK
jgi:hypothetical protein